MNQEIVSWLQGLFYLSRYLLIIIVSRDNNRQLPILIVFYLYLPLTKLSTVKKLSFWSKYKILLFIYFWKLLPISLLKQYKTEKFTHTRKRTKKKNRIIYFHINLKEVIIFKIDKKKTYFFYQKKFSNFSLNFG